MSKPDFKKFTFAGTRINKDALNDIAETLEGRLNLSDQSVVTFVLLPKDQYRETATQIENLGHGYPALAFAVSGTAIFPRGRIAETFTIVMEEYPERDNAALYLTRGAVVAHELVERGIIELPSQDRAFAAQLRNNYLGNFDPQESTIITRQLPKEHFEGVLASARYAFGKGGLPQAFQVGDIIYGPIPNAQDHFGLFHHATYLSALAREGTRKLDLIPGR